MNKQGKEILISLIDRAIEKYDVENNQYASICYRGNTEKELDLLRYREVKNLIVEKISQLGTGSATPKMEIARLEQMRQELYRKDQRIFFNLTDEEINENVQLVNQKIEQIKNEIKERQETIKFLVNVCDEINLQLNLESLTV